MDKKYAHIPGVRYPEPEEKPKRERPVLIVPKLRCRNCKGTGQSTRWGKPAPCPQCAGAGRIELRGRRYPRTLMRDYEP